MNNVIEDIMIKKKLSLHQIANLINFDVSVVSRVRNRVQKMSMNMAYKISKVFGYDLDEIIKIEGIK